MFEDQFQHFCTVKAVIENPKKKSKKIPSVIRKKDNECLLTRELFTPHYSGYKGSVM